jgi:axial budding pattern protein 2
MYLTAKQRPSLALSLLAATSIATAAPELAFPINSQIPPVAYASRPFDFIFSESTFTSSAPQISYVINNAPKWLSLDSNSRALSGTPGQADIGAANFELVASDSAGRTSASVTLVVQSSIGVQPGQPILPQLQRSGTVVTPNSLLLQTQQAFHVSSQPDTFSGATASTKYYAVSADNTPLPPWIQFDDSDLSFSGTTPTLVSSLGGPQEYGFKLIASDVPGFAEAAVEFNLVISERVLAFNQSSTSISFTPGVHLETASLRPMLTLNGAPVADNQIVSVTAVNFGELQLDKQAIKLQGTLESDADITVTISVSDVYGDVANTTVVLTSTQATTNKTVPLGAIADLNITTGTFFSYPLATPQFSPTLRASANLGNASSWLTFDRHNWTLYGQVPADHPAGTINVPIEFENATTTESGEVVLRLQLAVAGSPTASSAHTATNPPHVQESVTNTALGTASSTATAAGVSSASGAHVLHIILAVVFSLIGALCLPLLAIFYIRRRRAKKGKSSPNSSEETPPVAISETASAQQSEPVLYNGQPITVHRTPPPRPPRIDLTWSNDSFRQSGQRLSGSIRPAPLSLHRTTQSLAENQVWSLEAAMMGESGNAARRTRPSVAISPPPVESLPVKPSPAVLARSLTAITQSQPRPASTVSRQSTLSPSLRLPDRRSGAGHGSSIFGSLDQMTERASWRNSWLTNVSTDNGRTTAVLNSFPNPPGDRAAVASLVRPPSRGKHKIPVLRVVSEDSIEEPTFEEQRQRWYTERARARLEGSVRFSNAGSKRTFSGPSTLRRVTSSDAARAAKASAIEALKPSIANTSGFREHSWSRWSGVGPAAQHTPRMQSPALRSQPSVASSGQFESMTSSDSQWEDENLVAQETGKGTRKWQTDTGSSQASPWLPFSPVPPAREKMASNSRNASGENARQQTQLADGRKRVSMEAAGLPRSCGSQRGSFRFI